MGAVPLYRRLMPRVLGGSWGVGVFLWAQYAWNQNNVQCFLEILHANQ